MKKFLRSLYLVFFTLNLHAMEGKESSLEKMKKWWLQHFSSFPIEKKEDKKSDTPKPPLSVEIQRKSVLDGKPPRSSEMPELPTPKILDADESDHLTSSGKKQKPTLAHFLSQGVHGMSRFHMAVIFEAFEKGKREYAEGHMIKNSITPDAVFERALSEKKYIVASCAANCKNIDRSRMLLNAVMAYHTIYSDQKKHADMMGSFEKLRDRGDNKQDEKIKNERTKLDVLNSKGQPIFEIIRAILETDKDDPIDVSEALDYATKKKMQNVIRALELIKTAHRMEENIENNIKRIRENSSYRREYEDFTGIKVFSDEQIEDIKAQSFSDYSTPQKNEEKLKNQAQ
jgi:hypothetical protein